MKLPKTAPRSLLLLLAISAALAGITRGDPPPGAPPQPRPPAGDDPAGSGEPAPPNSPAAQPEATDDAPPADVPPGLPPRPEGNPSSTDDSATPRTESPAAVGETVLREYLVLPRVGTYGRFPFHQDPLESQLIRDAWEVPQVGTEVTAEDGKVARWSRVVAEADGQLVSSALRGGYALARYESKLPEATTMILVAQGHSMVFVNGQPRIGDHYNYGWVRLPVRIEPGSNTFLFHVGSGKLSARLVQADSTAQFNFQDSTLPDLVIGETEDPWAGVVILNTTDEPLRDLVLRCGRAADREVTTKVPPIGPRSCYKAGFQVDGATKLTAPGRDTQYLRLVHEPSGDVLAEHSVDLAVVNQDDRQRRTFVSNIDGSVQYYSVRPSLAGAASERGMILTLHGAAVNAQRQTEVYAAKEWAHIVAPTNRRPFGFDWEDWGRIDAFEAMADARQHFKTNPAEVYLTGHSMGGHGTWHLGVTYPDRFAAIGPSAGWHSFWSYGRMPSRTPDNEIDRMLVRSVTPSDTTQLQRNLAELGVYVLHGDADKNVPVDQARYMRAQLGGFHPDFAYFEQPQAGHWWGDVCCDWPPMMDFFQRRKRPDSKEVQHVDFRTANPGISAEAYWVRIEAQPRQLEVSRVALDRDLEKRKVSGTTSNVSRLSLDLTDFGRRGKLEIQLDGQTVSGVRGSSLRRRVWLEKEDDRWKPVSRPSAKLKGPARYGTFKSVFNNRVVLVYGTSGSDAENQWAYSKARFDAEQFWYRGNGSFEVVADTDFDPDADRNRNVVLYGNADTNRVWPALLSTSQVQVRNGLVRFGTRPEQGDDLACLFVRPRPRSNTAVVGIVSGTGLEGMRLTNRLRYFVSGVAYPDVTIFGPQVLADGSRDVRVAGFFGIDWQIESSDFVWRDLAL